MADVEVRVIGISQALENFKQLADGIQKRVTRKAAREAAKLILKAIKATTYSGDRKRQTGLLLRSQGVATSSRNGVVRGKVVMREISTGGKSKLARAVRKKRQQLTLKTSAFYWRFLERGTSKMSARPWIEPAFDRTQSAALDQFAQVFNAETEAETAKLSTRKP